MIASTKERFATKMDLKALEKYEKWIYDTDEISEFPYRYAMWQYSKEGEVRGIEGPVNMDISFVDYSIR